MRKPFPRTLDKAAASPVGDVVEFRFAFLEAKKTFRQDGLMYVGTDGTEHYFQAWGDPSAYVVPASKGWKARA